MQDSVDDSHDQLVGPAIRFVGDFERLQLHYTRHKDVDSSKRGHTAIYCGYESGEWNYRQFFTWVNEHIMTFALNSKEIRLLGDRSAPEQVERAAGNIYSSRHKFLNRGELGELILHGLIRDIYNTTPLISKIYRKTATGDTVKGADCVHVIEIDGEIDSLWLGESKFKKVASRGIGEAVKSVTEMIDSLSNWEEFIVIKQHLDDDLAISNKVERMLSKASSLDDIKAKICVPVLITYESDAARDALAHTEEFVTQLNEEVEPHIKSFLDKTEHIQDVDIHVFFMPLKSKDALVTMFDKYLDKKRPISYDI